MNKRTGPSAVLPCASQMRRSGVLMVYRREEAGKRTVQGHEPKLIYRETLDVEDQVRVGGNIRRSTLLAVC
jgi:hypothetical protein